MPVLKDPVDLIAGVIGAFMPDHPKKALAGKRFAVVKVEDENVMVEVMDVDRFGNVLHLAVEVLPICDFLDSANLTTVQDTDGDAHITREISSDDEEEVMTAIGTYGHDLKVPKTSGEKGGSMITPAGSYDESAEREILRAIEDTLTEQTAEPSAWREKRALWYDKGKGYAPSTGDLNLKEGEDIYEALGHVHENWTASADWADSILPSMRRDAGYRDSGMGTYQIVPNGVDPIELDESLAELSEEFWAGFDSKVVDSIGESICEELGDVPDAIGPEGEAIYADEQHPNPQSVMEHAGRKFYLYFEGDDWDLYEAGVDHPVTQGRARDLAEAEARADTWVREREYVRNQRGESLEEGHGNEEEEEETNYGGQTDSGETSVEVADEDDDVGQKEEESLESDVESSIKEYYHTQRPKPKDVYVTSVEIKTEEGEDKRPAGKAIIGVVSLENKLVIHDLDWEYQQDGSINIEVIASSGEDEAGV